MSMLSGLVDNAALWSGISLILLISYHFIPSSKKNIHVKFIFLVLSAAGLTYGINIALKDFFAVPRPCAGLALCPLDFSFPSSHASVAFAAMGVLGMLSTPLSLILAALLAVSRVFEGVHTWTDVTGGAVLGLGVAALIYLSHLNDFKGGSHGHQVGERRDTNTRRR